METQALDHVVYEKDGPIARIILNNPDRANAQTSQMVHSVNQALDDAQYDYDIKVVIIKANGKGFCSGHVPDGSYPEFKAELDASGKVWRSAAQLFLWPVLKLWEFPKPVIAQVHGYAIGGGTTWALIPEITVCSEDAWFQMPLVPGFGLPGSETMFEPWVFMNYKRAAEYLYTAQKITCRRGARVRLGEPGRARGSARGHRRGAGRQDRQGTVDHAAGHQGRHPAGLGEHGVSHPSAGQQ